MSGEYSSMFPRCGFQTFHRTEFGEMVLGDSRSYMFHGVEPNSVDLIMTSPPFALLSQKAYGNESEGEYCNWFRPFAEGFKRILKDSGSLVIDMGGAWVPGQPTRSLYQFKVLIMLVEELGFHLCQEHYWWNPSKMPAPAEWVNVHRVRVKDSINCVWWLSKTPHPKANNRRVLQPYSKKMRHIIKNGREHGIHQPSGHTVSKHFQKDNGGAIPPNLLAIANTDSRGPYYDYCKQQNLPIHPARFPSKLPEYFVRFLTDRGDVVVDPFAGSCTTGWVSERLGRRWVCCEQSEEYLKGALARFGEDYVEPARNVSVKYEIAAPCSIPVDEGITSPSTTADDKQE